jgi:serine/threonine-protein kinase
MNMAHEQLGDPRAAANPERLRRRRFGQRLGRYRLGAMLGAGGAASVYMARLEGPHGFERVLALKVVHEHLLGDQGFVATFLDEANLSVRLSHPAIVHTYELGHDDDFLFIAMEYLQGQPLSRLCWRAKQLGQALPSELVAWIGERAAGALHYAHELCDAAGRPLGIVHRDVSPDNLFITYDGEVKLLDFGIARAERRLAATKLGELKGKLRYMAPEYALGERCDRTVDLFALGATLYEAAAGAPAFDGEDEGSVLERLLNGGPSYPVLARPDFSEALWQVLSSALHKDSAQRFADGKSMGAALAPLMASDGATRLSALMRSWFSAELAKETAELAELSDLPRDVESESTSVGHELEPRRETSQRKWRAAAWTATAMLAAVALTLWFTGAGARGERAAPLPRASAAAALRGGVAPSTSFEPARVPGSAPPNAAFGAVQPLASVAVSPSPARSASSGSARRTDRAPAAPRPPASGLIKQYPF